MRVLILCTGNSCRSQMAEGYLKSFDPQLAVFSAGTNPADRVHPMAVQVMAEDSIDLNGNRPKNVDEFLGQPFDYVITVCGEADQNCPAFSGDVRHRVHIGFDDPAKTTDIAVFRRVRDQIRGQFHDFYQKEMKGRA